MPDKLKRFKRLAERAFESATSAVEVEPPPPASPRAARLGVSERLPGARLISVDLIESDPSQPRKRWPADALADLSASIRSHGILQPLLVTSNANGGYRIVAGERRFRAARMAGIERVPCLVVGDLDAPGRLETQLIENLQRQDLDPLEECDALEVLRNRCGLTHHQIAQRIGKSRTYVTKTLGLRKIPEQIRQEIIEAGVASREPLVLLSQQPNETAMKRVWHAIKADRANVRTLRSASQPARKQPASGRRGASAAFHLSEVGAIVTVRFRKARASASDVVMALEKALERARLEQP